MSDPLGEAFLKASETYVKSVPVNIGKCLQRKMTKDLRMILRFSGRKSLEETVQLFSRYREDLGSCSKAHPRKNSQICLKNIEVTLETFWKI